MSPGLSSIVMVILSLTSYKRKRKSYKMRTGNKGRKMQRDEQWKFRTAGMLVRVAIEADHRSGS
jgi:hypothetical protein